jgi:hypothetical protein
MPKRNAPVHRFQPVAYIGKRAADDYAHRVIQVRPLHFVFDIDGNQVLVAAVAAAHSGQDWLPVRGWRRWTLWWLLLVCQADS